MTMDRKTWGFMLAGLALAVALAFVVAPFASSNPDGLDRVSQDHGFAEAAEGAQVWRRAPIPEYSFPRMDGRLSTGVAGVIGTLGVAGIAFLGARMIRARRRIGSADPR
jgi:cobalt/nickel transport protein